MHHPHTDMYVHVSVFIFVQKRGCVQLTIPTHPLCKRVSPGGSMGGGNIQGGDTPIDAVVRAATGVKKS